MAHESEQHAIDLRSDTVTKPTEAMRLAMANADVGDDVLGDDPTVKLLEQETARVLGKQAALFVPSGTMANQIALKVLTRPGDEILVEGESHIYYYEAGGMAVLSGLLPRCIPGERGIFTPDTVKQLLRPPDVHFTPTRLLCIENTHNRGGGSVWKLNQVQAVTDLAQELGIKRHLDGARLWNASIATGIPESSFADCFDSVSVCFSKGLGAPVGSCVAGSMEFIEQAKRVRKLLGGGMRQSGILAAGALHAMRHHRERLLQDHLHAKDLARHLAALPGIAINEQHVESNIVRFNTTSLSAKSVVERLAKECVHVLTTSPDTIRMVTHLMISPSDILRVKQILTNVFSGHVI